MIGALLREGSRHKPGGPWQVLIAAGSVAAALYVLWIGALATIVGDLALDLFHLLVPVGLARNSPSLRQRRPRE